MEMAVQLAYENVLAKNGGPFGAIIVKDGKVVGRGCNNVTTANDPTAHAEVQAIRDACRNLDSFQLTDCEIYTSCEPCPMCIGAIYWARPKAIYYACTKEDAANIGFDDHFIYQELALPMENRTMKMKQLSFNDHDLPFRTWETNNEKVKY
ncbi:MULTISPECIES: nucleoside deaminase [Peribacillus]|uniref:nucleoside deaminase n=1 Tax=Peribacillus TaxID=2675229 RepID=UPI001F4E9336|nr:MULTISPECIES: nucleoside deaminase [unclassified Peribacillus]MCK1982916.1 nucleoside deaminase [Peribacillus sp. Aquil_B1]MCK2008692.1 nucleoside deaminase [Peribacillus sp. Aquil_B8]